MKKMFHGREHDELGQMNMENWPLDLASKLFWLHGQGQFPRRGQSQSLKTVGLRETRKRKIGDSKCTQPSQGVFLWRGAEERGNSLRRSGVHSGFCGWETLLMFVCAWEWFSREGNTDDVRRREEMATAWKFPAETRRVSIPGGCK